MNSLGSGSTGSAKRKRPKPARVEQHSQEEEQRLEQQQALPDRQTASEQTQDDFYDPAFASSSGSANASNMAELAEPAEPSKDPGSAEDLAELAEPSGPRSAAAEPLHSGRDLPSFGRTHQYPDQILSPSGYILGFLQPDNLSHTALLFTEPSSQLWPDPSSSSSSGSQPPSSSSAASDPSQASSSEAKVSTSEEEEQASFARASEEEQRSRTTGARSAAVRLLLGYMGALQASQYAAEAFVTSVVKFYRYSNLFL